MTEDSCASANPSSELNSFKFGKNMSAGKGDILVFVALYSNEAVWHCGGREQTNMREGLYDGLWGRRDFQGAWGRGFV